MTRTDDIGERALSAGTAVFINVSIFLAMALAGLAVEEAKPPEYVMASMVELPRLGETPPDPKALPRIIKPPAPPPPETDAVSLSREREEELEKKKREKEKEIRKLADERRRLDEKRKRDEARKKRVEDRKRRKALMAEALKDIDDPRAEDEDAPGFKQGHKLGRSTDPNSLRNEQMYASLVSAVLQRQFEVPATISAEVRRSLVVEVFFKIDQRGKVVGQPKVVKTSGNSFFDRAAERTVRRFGPGSGLRIPLPTDKKLKATILRRGIRARMKGRS
jgi:colicin import membrane protein